MARNGGGNVVAPGAQNNPQLIGQTGEPVNLAQANAQARQMVLQQSLSMCQRIQSYTVMPANGNVIQFVPRNVGLVKGFWVEMTATVVNTTAGALTLTPWGPANLVSNFTFTDLSNNQRINTSGWHMNLINTVKGNRPFASAFTNDSPINYGSNYNWIVAPSTIAANTTPQTIKMLYYVPLAYHAMDLRGSIYFNTINATALLSVTINPNAFVASGGDPTLAMYTGNAAASITNVTVTFYQDYLSQLPVSQQGVILPAQDLSTVYMLNSTALFGMVENQDFPVPYSNFRQFLSTAMIFDNGGTLSNGSDLNYIALQSANFTNIFQVDPNLLAVWTRQNINTDMPIGTYYVDTRRKPLSTVQYGNLQINLNASTVNSGAVVYPAWEAFAMLNQITGAGSLPAS